MGFYLQINKVKNISRDEEGYPYSWTNIKTVAVCRSEDEFINYVRKNIKRMKNKVAFTGSASLLTAANAYITNQLKEAGVL